MNGAGNRGWSTLACLLFLLCCLPSPAFAKWEAADVLRTYITKNYPWADVELGDVKLSSAAPDRNPRAITVVKAPPGKAVFRLAFSGDISITATVMVKAFDRIMVSRGAFGKGYTLRKDDVYETLMESGRIPQGALRDEERVIDKTLTRSIISNAVITGSMVSENTIVKRGHRIVLCVEKPGFTIKTVGEMKQDASVGDYVKALNLLSKKIITGRLVNENTVRVEF